MKNTTRYTITDIAKELGITRQTVYYWIKKKWVIPKRDYRNYPVFSNKDLSRIKKWHGALNEDVIPPKQTTEKKPPLRALPLTWEEIQKSLFV